MKATPAPDVIPSKAQVQQPLEFKCLREFPDSPSIQISYTIVGKAVSFVVPLPIFITKFLSPKPSSGPDFLQTWKGIVGPGLEAQEIFPSKTPIDLAYLNKLFGQGFRYNFP